MCHHDIYIYCCCCYLLSRRGYKTASCARRKHPSVSSIEEPDPVAEARFRLRRSRSFDAREGTPPRDTRSTLSVYSSSCIRPRREKPRAFVRNPTTQRPKDPMDGWMDQPKVHVRFLPEVTDTSSSSSSPDPLLRQRRKEPRYLLPPPSLF